MKTRFLLFPMLALLIVAQPYTVYAGDSAADLKGVKNFRQVSENRFSAGHPNPASFPALADKGVSHIINLRPLSETPDYNEAAVATRSGMAYYNIPISSAADLNRDNVEILDQQLKQIGSNGVLIHCASGNRVGAMMALRAAWLQGANKEEALEVGKAWGLTKLAPVVEELLAE
jgi:uncharacterized protein (TIGR01244 family)